MRRGGIDPSDCYAAHFSFLIRVCFPHPAQAAQKKKQVTHAPSVTALKALAKSEWPKPYPDELVGRYYTVPLANSSVRSKVKFCEEMQRTASPQALQDGGSVFTHASSSEAERVFSLVGRFHTNGGKGFSEGRLSVCIEAAYNN